MTTFRPPGFFSGCPSYRIGRSLGSEQVGDCFPATNVFEVESLFSFFDSRLLSCLLSSVEDSSRDSPLQCGVVSRPSGHAKSPRNINKVSQNLPPPFFPVIHSADVFPTTFMRVRLRFTTSWLPSIVRCSIIIVPFAGDDRHPPPSPASLSLVLLFFVGFFSFPSSSQWFLFSGSPVL